MPLLPLVLVLGGLTPAAAEPGPGPAAELARVARLGVAPGRDAAPPGATATETAEYAAESAARGELSYALPAGPRTVRALEVEPSPATAEAWRLARLRLTWEDDDPWSDGSAVDLPLGLVFGRGSGLPAVESAAVGTANGAWVNRFPMPYRTRALLRVSTDRPIEGRIRVRTTRGVAADAGYFRGDRLSSRPRAAVTGRGRGHLAGIFAVTEGPAPAGPGRLVVDGKPGGSLAATLGIDARRDPARSGPGPVRGVLFPAGDAGRPAARSAAYRWFLVAPVAFEDSFAIEAGADPGDAPAPASVQTAAVFWYSESPGGLRGGP